MRESEQLRILFVATNDMITFALSPSLAATLSANRGKRVRAPNRDELLVPFELVVHLQLCTDWMSRSIDTSAVFTFATENVHICHR